MIQDPGAKIQDPGYKFLDPGSWIQDPQDAGDKVPKTQESSGTDLDPTLDLGSCRIVFTRSWLRFVLHFFMFVEARGLFLSDFVSVWELLVTLRA